jgi:hypothetical protein
MGPPWAEFLTLFKVGARLLNLAVVGYLAYRKRLLVGI